MSKVLQNIHRVGITAIYAQLYEGVLQNQLNHHCQRIALAGDKQKHTA